MLEDKRQSFVCPSKCLKNTASGISAVWTLLLLHTSRFYFTNTILRLFFTSLITITLSGKLKLLKEITESYIGYKKAFCYRNNRFAEILLEGKYSLIFTILWSCNATSEHFLGSGLSMLLGNYKAIACLKKSACFLYAWPTMLLCNIFHS